MGSGNGVSDLLLQVGLSGFQGESSISSVASVLGLDDGSGIVLEGLWGDSVSLLGWGGWAASDSLEDLGEHGFDGVNSGGLQTGGPFAELSLESFFALFLQLSHVLVDVASEDSVSVGLWVVSPLLGLFVLLTSVEVSGVVRDVQSSVTGTLEDGVDSVTDGRVGESDIQNGLEWSSVVGVGLGEGSDVVVLSGDFFGSLVHVSESKLGEESSGQKESSGVGSTV